LSTSSLPEQCPVREGRTAQRNLRRPAVQSRLLAGLARKRLATLGLPMPSAKPRASIDPSPANRASTINAYDDGLVPSHAPLAVLTPPSWKRLYCHSRSSEMAKHGIQIATETGRRGFVGSSPPH
jgi:hypothetical protein